MVKNEKEELWQLQPKTKKEIESNQESEEDTANWGGSLRKEKLCRLEGEYVEKPLRCR